MPDERPPVAPVTGVDYAGIERWLQVQCPFCGELHVHEWPRIGGSGDPGAMDAPCGGGTYYIESPEPPPPPGVG